MNTNLVKKRTTRLSPEKTAALLSMVEECFRNHEPYFKEAERNKADIHRTVGVPTLNADGTMDTDSDPRLVVNFFWAYVRATAPMLFCREPHYTCHPRLPYQEASAKTWEALMDAAVSRTGFKDETDKAVLDALYYNEWVKKWTYTTSEPQEVYTGEAGAAEVEDDVETEVEDGGATSWDNIDAPIGVRVCPLNFATDDPNRKLERSRFVVCRYKRYWDELIADPRYKKITQRVREQVTGRSEEVRIHGSRLGMDHDPREIDADRDQVWVFEVWVNQLVDFKLRRQLVVLLEGYSDSPIDVRPWSDLVGPYVTGYPFTKVDLFDVPDGRAASVFAAWRSIAYALNTVTSRISARVGRLSTKYELNESMCQDASKAAEALLSNRATEVIKTKNQEGKPAVIPIAEPGIPQDLFQLQAMLISLLTQIAAFSQNQRGGAGVRTATEADLISQSLQVRQDAMILKVMAGLKADGEMLVRMLRHAVTADFVFPITGSSGGIKWQQFTEQDAAWSPDVRVEPGSFRKGDMAQEAQKYLQVLSVGTQLAQLYKIRLDVVLHKYMKMLEIPEADRIIGDPVDDRQTQLEEIILMMMGQEAPVHAEDNHAVHHQVIQEFLASGLGDEQIRETLMIHDEQHVQAMQQIPTPEINMTGGTQTFGNMESLGGIASGVSADQGALAGASRVG